MLKAWSHCRPDRHCVALHLWGGVLFLLSPDSPLSLSSTRGRGTLWRGRRTLSSQPTPCQNQAAMLLVQWVFSVRITQLNGSTVLVQQLHLPGLQLWQGLPDLAQGQLRKEQEAVTKQKQQRSRRASIFFGCLLPRRLAGGVHHGQGEACIGCLLCENHVFLSATSGVRSGGSAMGNWLQQRQPLIAVFRGVWCNVGAGMRHKFWHRI
jgi:hypothetical protein